MKTKKGDFVELDFTATVKEGKVFDTTKEKEARKANLFDEKKNHKFEPMSVCIGEGMVIKGLDEALVDKDIGKEYEIEIQPKEAFGNRNAKLIKTVPLSAFQEMPHPGMFVNVNGLVARVVTVTGGRTLIDLNNPLAGKIIIYKFEINKNIEDISKKIKLIAGIFGLEIENIKIEEKQKKVKIKIKNKKQVEKILDKFNEKIKSLLGLGCEFD